MELVTEGYIRSARPVASKFIAERLKVSSATVRNDFSALEEEGYLHQPHTSAGRVPTARAYESYARKFIPPGRLSKQQRQLLTAYLHGSHGELATSARRRRCRRTLGLRGGGELTGGQRPASLRDSPLERLEHPPVSCSRVRKRAHPPVQRRTRPDADTRGAARRRAQFAAARAVHRRVAPGSQRHCQAHRGVLGTDPARPR